MAANDQDVSNRFPADLTLCPLCFNPFDEFQRIPKYLDCHHTFCSLCLCGFQRCDNVLSCPICMGTTYIEGNSAEHLKTNVFALQLACVSAERLPSTQRTNQEKARNNTGAREWCAGCSSLATQQCVSDHITLELETFVADLQSTLREGVDELAPLWNRALVNQSEIQYAYHHATIVLAFLDTKLQHWICASRGALKDIATRSRLANSLNFPLDLNAPDEEVTSTISKLNALTSNLEQWKEEARFLSSNPVNATEHLPPFNSRNLPPPNSECVAVLSFLSLLLSRDTADSGELDAINLQQGDRDDNTFTNVQDAVKSPRKRAPRKKQPKSEDARLKQEKVWKSEVHEPDGRPLNLSLAVDSASTEAVVASSETMASSGGESVGSPRTRSGASRQRSLDPSPAEATSATSKKPLDDANHDGPWKCPLCEKVFQSKKGHYQHMKTHSIHSMSCPFCGKDFKWETSLKIHLRTHTGERPYQCTKCLKEFYRSDHHKQHQKKCRNLKPK